MIREVDLNSYLPNFLQEYDEIKQSLLAEDPEFIICWNAANRVLRNEFIDTADEYGLSRFEKLLRILPDQEDTLDSRRARVRSKWFNQIPYTLRTLIQKLINLCGGEDFTVVKHFSNYRLEINTHLELFGQLEQLNKVLDEMIPCNIVTEVRNEVIFSSSPNLKIGVVGHIMPILHTERSG